MSAFSPVMQPSIVRAIMRGIIPQPPSSLPDFLTGFTAANTANAKQAINDVIAGLGSRHWCVPGNSTKAGWGSGGIGYGIPAGAVTSNSFRALGQVEKWADLLAAAFGIKTSSDNVWGSAGATSMAQYMGYDPRVTVSGAPIFSTSVLGPGGGSFTVTNLTDSVTFTLPDGRTFDRASFFYADIGQTFKITGSNGDVLVAPSTSTGNFIRRYDAVFTSDCTSFTISGTAASGFRVYGWFTEKSDESVLHIHNMGWGNSNSTNWANTAFGQAPRDAIVHLAPQLVLFSEAINDPNTGVSLTTHNSNVRAFLNNVRAAGTDIIVYEDHWTASLDVDGASGHATLANIIATQNGNAASAAALGIGYINTPKVYGSFQHQKVDLNFMFDVSHMTGAGQADEAANVLMPAALLIAA